MKKTLLALSLLLAQNSALALKLEFLADLSLPARTEFQRFLAGGFSGMAFDAMTGQYLVLSDDRSQNGPARFYRSEIDFVDGKIDFKLLDSVFFKQDNGWIMKSAEVDTESMVRSQDGTLFVGSEGDAYFDRATRKEIFRFAPALYHFNGGGEMMESVAIPDKYIPESFDAARPAAPTKGMLFNKGFEGLALSADETFLLAAPEAPLLQDDSLSDFKKGSNIRLLRYAHANGSLMPNAEFVYPLSSVKREAGMPDSSIVENGISEIMMLGEDSFLAMERGTVRRSETAPYERQVRLFEFHMKDASDVKNASSLRDANFVPVQKELILDLQDIVSKLNPEYQILDNLEALAYGPTLKNGNRTLIVMSDDNFNEDQRTQILMFEIKN